MANDNIELQLTGRLVRIARIKSEFYESFSAPLEYLERITGFCRRVDIFSFLQAIDDTKPKYPFHMEWASIAVLPISTYDYWWNTQINGKTRNMLRRAQKMGVKIQIVKFDDDFVKGIKAIYDESPRRQGQPFKHYGKSLDTIKKEHITYLDRSDFVGAYDGEELIGFVKLVHSKGFSSLMQIISKISCRNKAPNNALIAKAVEICAQRNTPYLHYGYWGRRHGLADFKTHHAFEKYDVPRYFIPLTAWGAISLRLGLHKRLADRFPENYVIFITGLLRKWGSITHFRPRSINGQ